MVIGEAAPGISPGRWEEKQGCYRGMDLASFYFFLKYILHGRIEEESAGLT